MFTKPDILIRVAPYNDVMENMYKELEDSLKTAIEHETLKHLTVMIYKEGVKDGIEFYRDLQN